MLLQEYDEAKQRELDRRDNYEDGLNDGNAEGKIEGRAEDLLMVLALKGDVPESLASSVLSEKNTEKLADWFKAALYSETIDSFRTKTGL